MGLVTAAVFNNLCDDMIVTTEWTEWYGVGSLLAVLACLALAVHAFRISLGKQHVMGREAPGA